METFQQFCPICKTEVHYSERYPRYVCTECVDKATDSKGRKVRFYNTTAWGQGCEGRYADTKEVYNRNVCFIEGVECFAAEARFGGIVIQTSRD